MAITVSRPVMLMERRVEWADIQSEDSTREAGDDG
jgi:hypothetical protein